MFQLLVNIFLPYHRRDTGRRKGFVVERKLNVKSLRHITKSKHRGNHDLFKTSDTNMELYRNVFILIKLNFI